MKRQKISLPRGLEIADTPRKRALGLMFRKSPRPLLMDFEKQGNHGIWMLFMRFPIDLIFLDKEKRVITTYKNIKPITLNPKTWKIYRPGSPARYALEIPAQARAP